MITFVALPFQVKELTNSFWAVGLIGVVEIIPLTIFGLYGGVLADHVDRKKMIWLTEFGTLIATFILFINARRENPSVVLLFVIAAIFAALSGLKRPSQEAILPRLVSHDDLPSASVLMSLRWQFGGIVGPITDKSSIPDRTNYTIDYIKELDNMKKNNIEVPDCYVSCTNIYSLEAAAKLDYKIIFPYKEYKFGYFLDKSIPGWEKPGDTFDLSGKKIMLAITPIIRDTQEEIDREFPKDVVVNTPDGKSYKDRPRFAKDTAYFTYDKFVIFMKELESKGIHEVLLNGFPESERDSLISYIKKYKEEEDSSI